MAVNPEYETETAWTYETGLKKYLGFATTFRAAAYYTDISDYQQHNYQASAMDVVQSYNVDTQVYGLELDLTRRLSEGLSGYLVYTWKNWSTEDHPLDDPNTHYFMQNQPRNIVKAGVNYSLWEGGVVTLNSKYIDQRESQSGKKLKEVILVDVGAEHTFSLEHRELKLKGYVNNVTDQDYKLRAGYPMPGITAGIQAELSF